MKLRVASWNVNSIRIRIDGIRRLVDGYQPDVLCLQETKVVDREFPHKPMQKLGFEHISVHGQKGYNGVAILSRLPLEGIPRKDWCGKDDCRHLCARLPGGIEVHNFYVPSGGDIPDPEQNDKFAHKLQFMAEVDRWFRRRRRADDRAILVGDLNVAPHPNDVWSHRQLLGVVSHTPVEVAALTRLAGSRQWVDAVRHFIPESIKLYSWWSYRSPNWQRSDRGRRLDHVWVTPALVGALDGAEVIRAARGWPKPSDHVPVIVTLSLPASK